MYKYLIFAGDNYYPECPSDFRKAFVKFDDAVTFRDEIKRQDTHLRGWVEIYTFDAETGEFKPAC